VDFEAYADHTQGPHALGPPPGGGQGTLSTRLTYWRNQAMTRKNFVAIAQAIRNNIANREQRQALAVAILPALSASNPRFDSRRFMSAAVGE